MMNHSILGTVTRRAVALSIAFALASTLLACAKQSDLPSSTADLQTQAQRGHPQAQYVMGQRYARGFGVPLSYANAITWYAEAANQGHKAAQYALGMAYENGQGVRPSYIQAITWYTKAATQGYAPAQYSLGLIYELGLGIKRNRKRSLTWYRRAAANGHAAAHYHLSTLLAGTIE